MRSRKIRKAAERVQDVTPCLEPIYYSKQKICQPRARPASGPRHRFLEDS